MKDSERSRCIGYLLMDLPPANDRPGIWPKSGEHFLLSDGDIYDITQQCIMQTGDKVLRKIVR